MKSGLLLLTIISITLFLTSNLSAICEEGQIDINTASAVDLEKIDHVGPKVAEYIIDKRPFSSLEDLVEVDYISEGYVEDIKSQGLACIEEEGDNEEITNEEENFNSTSNSELIEDNNGLSDIKISPENINLEAININAKAIKSGENSEILNESNKEYYGLAGFAILLILLFLIRKIARKQNEFA